MRFRIAKFANRSIVFASRSPLDAMVHVSSHGWLSCCPQPSPDAFASCRRSSICCIMHVTGLFHSRLGLELGAQTESTVRQRCLEILRNAHAPGFAISPNSIVRKLNVIDLHQNPKQIHTDGQSRAKSEALSICSFRTPISSQSTNIGRDSRSPTSQLVPTLLGSVQSENIGGFQRQKTLIACQVQVEQLSE